ncbi:asparagine synthase-related protein [Paludisphaera soli]|uniref:asparagine synthase-related protein n=1 Tax=Paludisphaera soli TaxID=2712865 RepID=UPI0013EDBF08|nr:asparagine synthase-related protein [Paludisphaera soli]
MGYLGWVFSKWPSEEGAMRNGAVEPASPAVRVLDRTGRRLGLRTSGEFLRTAARGRVTLLVRGLMVLSGDEGPPSSRADRAVEAAFAHYAARGDLPAERFEGSFTLVLIDEEAGRVLLFRNLVGAGFTYYAETDGGLLFGSNPAELAEYGGAVAAVNDSALPAFFLYRFVPGRETLFRGVRRLLPGEMLAYDRDGLRLRQRQTIGGLRGGETGDGGGDAVERLGATMARVLADCALDHPGAVNLLSGGVDSSYIQVVWNEGLPASSRPPATYTINVDHPRTLPDAEYALSAASLLGTRHTLVPADDYAARYLVEAVAGTGEPPNHVQSIYFRRLGRVLADRGVPAALCGEGADSLFGVGSTATLQTAEALRRVLPWKFGRDLVSAAAAFAGHPRLPGYLDLAGRLGDFTHPGHPVNEVAVFADLRAVHSCFGEPAASSAFALRRELARMHGVADDPLEFVNFAGFLGEAADTASLWTGLFNLEGCDMRCPFLDSRMIRFAIGLRPQERYPFRKPKELLKRALRRRAPAVLADRSKRGFGQPIFEWLAVGGQLRPLVDRIGDYDFVAHRALAEARERPNWFLYSLLCFDVWHKLFIEKRPASAIADAT